MIHQQIDLSVLNRHERKALCVSGGKDSLAVVYLLRDYLPSMMLYHIDTGDLLPETREIVAHVKSMAPHFVHLQGDIESWIATHGMPTDLMPHSAHPVGALMGENKVPLVARYDCCWANLMHPLYARIAADGCTLLIRGTKRIDMNRLPIASGGAEHGIEYLYPIQEWSNAEVFAYLREVGAPISRVYQHVTNSPECARCTAWWSEQRAAYLKAHHPALYDDYRNRLMHVAAELTGPVAALRHELNEMELL